MSDTDKTVKGNVEFFNNAKGWGIIKGENGDSYFIHHNDIVDVKFFPDNNPKKFRTLKDGEEVIFEVGPKEDSKFSPARNLVIVTKE
jgi:cold shock CspA family protein